MVGTVVGCVVGVAVVVVGVGVAVVWVGVGVAVVAVGVGVTVVWVGVGVAVVAVGSGSCCSYSEVEVCITILYEWVSFPSMGLYQLHTLLRHVPLMENVIGAPLSMVETPSEVNTEGIEPVMPALPYTPLTVVV